MRSKFVFGSVILSGLLFTQSLLGKKESLPLSLSVRQQFETEISNLKRNLTKVSSTPAQWTQINKVESQISQLRKKNPLQLDQDEIYMDTVMASLAQIPRDAQFKKEKCDNYRSKIMVQFDPHGEDDPIPPVAETLSVLEILCK
jgi:hypothetical protein